MSQAGCSPRAPRTQPRGPCPQVTGELYLGPRPAPRRRQENSAGGTGMTSSFPHWGRSLWPELGSRSGGTNPSSRCPWRLKAAERERCLPREAEVQRLTLLASHTCASAREHTHTRLLGWRLGIRGETSSSVPTRSRPPAGTQPSQPHAERAQRPQLPPLRRFLPLAKSKTNTAHMLAAVP